MSHIPMIVAVSGPSGAGKTVLSNILKNEHNFSEVLSVTTRQKRHGEEQGVHYDFISNDKFNELAAQNELVEKVSVNGNNYGITSDEILKLAQQNKPIVVVAEPDGVRQIQEYCQEKNWNCLTVFINSPVDILMKRLLQRFNSEVQSLDVNDPDHLAKNEKLLSVYSSRIVHVLNEEQEHWVKPAYSDNSIFNLVFNEFNEKTQNKVIDKVILSSNVLSMNNTEKKLTM